MKNWSFEETKKFKDYFIFLSKFKFTPAIIDFINSETSVFLIELAY